MSAAIPTKAQAKTAWANYRNAKLEIARLRSYARLNSDMKKKLKEQSDKLDQSIETLNAFFEDRAPVYKEDRVPTEYQIPF